MKNQLLSLIAVTVLCLCSISSAGMMVYADADGFTDGTDISNAFSGMTLSSPVGVLGGSNGKVYAKTDLYASIGTKVFATYSDAPWISGRALRIDFHMFARYVTIDFVGQGSQGYGVMEAYNSFDALTGDFSTLLTDGQLVHAEIERQFYDIAYVLVWGGWSDFGTSAHLDNLSAEILPEPATLLLFALGAAFLRRKKSV